MRSISWRVRLLVGWLAFAAGPSRAAPPREPLALTVSPASGRAASFRSAGRRIGLEVFVPAGTGRHPAVLLLHGARGLSWSQQWLRAEAALLASHGRVGVVLHYFDAGADLAARRRCVADAVTALARHPAVAPGKTGLVGFSLGASVVLDVAARDPRIGAVVDFFGWLPDGARSETLPPVLILHGARDSSVPVSRARELAALLKRHHRVHEIHIYPDEEHGFEQASMEDALVRMLAFLHKHL